MKTNYYMCFIIILLFCVSSIVSIQDQLNSNEYDCINSLFPKLITSPITDYFAETSAGSGEYLYCAPLKPGFFDIKCDSTSKAITTILFFQNTETLIGTDDFSCFTIVQSLTLFSFKFKDNFLYGPFNSNNLQIIDIQTSPTILNIDNSNSIIPLKELKLSVYPDPALIKQINLSNFKSVEKLELDVIITQPTTSTSPTLTFPNDLIVTKEFKQLFSIEVSTLPSMNFIVMPYVFCQIKFLPNFDVSSFTNFATYTNIQLLSLYGTGNEKYVFPTSLPIVSDLRTIDIHYQLKIDGVPLDLSIYNSIDQVHLYNVGDTFSYNQQIAITKFPPKLKNVQIDNGSGFHFPNLNSYKGLLAVSFSKNQFLSNVLPIFDAASLPFLKTIRLDGNSFTGNVDKSYCLFEKLYLYNNSLTSSLPSCFICHLSYPNFASEILAGNNFNNVITTPFPTCTSIILNIEKSEIPGLYFIYGADIGFTKDFFTVDGYSVSTLIPIIPNKRFGINTGTSDIKSFKINYKYTTPIQTYEVVVDNAIEPFVETAVNNGDEFTFTGKYFSNNVTALSVLVSNLNCEITSCSFNEIKCKINGFPHTAVEQVIVVIKMVDLSTQITMKLNSNNQVIYCTTSCNSNGICLTSNGTCSCFDKQWYGPDCLIPYHFIKSVKPSTISGGNVTIYGVFGNVHKDLSVTLNTEICNVTSISPTLIACVALPGTGTKSIYITQNNILYTGIDMYNYESPIQSCLNNCSGNGQCDTKTSQCSCVAGYSNFDCSIKEIPNTNSQPPTNTTIDEQTGGTDLSNQEIKFSIYFKSLIEIDYQGNPIEYHYLKNNWIFNKSSSASNDNQFKFTQILDNGCIIESTIDEITNSPKQFTFAETTFTLNIGSIKYSISITSYPFKTNLNTLKLELISSVDDKQNIESNDNQCNSVDTEIDTGSSSSTFNYIQISKNNKILSGRFINKLMADGKSTYFKTTNTSDPNSVIVSLHLPHCDKLTIDPDFSVLIHPNFKPSCDDGNQDNRKWVIPVSVVVSVVGASIVAIALVLIYKKNSTTIKIATLKLKKLNYKN